jgi:formimidoylglutamate deiminase
VRAVDDESAPPAPRAPHAAASRTPQRPHAAPRRAAFHSLRAVSPRRCGRQPLQLRAIDAQLPLHIHVAEQLLEVRGVPQATGKRPVELLLDTGLLDSHWCLVHATHATGAELEGIAATGASVCVSISTEANLGDGFFDCARLPARARRLCIGSDSQSTVNPAEELRWLEYQQRLRRRRRGVLAGGTAAARRRSAVAVIGAVPARRPSASLSERSRPAGAPTGWFSTLRIPRWPGGLEAALDHLMFAGADRAISDVMVAGRWVIKAVATRPIACPAPDSPN